VITAAELRDHTVKDLATMARKKKVPGWGSMRKDELIHAIVRHARKEAAKRNGNSNGHTKAVKPPAGQNGHTSGNGSQANGNAAHANGDAIHANGNGTANGHGSHANGNGAGASHVQAAEIEPRSPHLEHRLQEIKAKLAEAKDLSFRTVADGRSAARDRIVVMVRDPYWLHANWELNRRSIERAEAALGHDWHGARPVLRLHEVSRNGTTSAARQTVRDIEIHGGVNNWYIDVQAPPKSFQIEIGYLTLSGRFYSLARSNVVTTPAVGSSNEFDRNWAEVAKDFDRVYAMTAGHVDQQADGELREVLEEHLHRPVGDPLCVQFGPGAAAIANLHRDFNFHVDTELIVHGKTHPDARVTLRGEPIRLRPDGSFAVRFSLPDRRHVLPVVAHSSDGVEQRTIVLAVDRNTKVMEPVIRDPSES